MYEALIDRLRCPGIRECPFGAGEARCSACRRTVQTEAADALARLESALAKAQAERDRAVADIPHKCWSCAGGFYTDEGFDCDQAHYRGRDPRCLSWRWRGYGPEEGPADGPDKEE